MIRKYEDSKIVFDNDGALGKSITEIGGNELVHLKLETGKIVPEHALPIEVTFFIVSGSGIISIDGEKFKAKKNDVVFVKSDSQRGWTNDSREETLELFVVKKIKE